MRSLHKVLGCVVPIKQQEVEPVLYSFSALFTILTSYFLLLPLREDAGISLGTSTLPLLFACSLVVTLLVTPTVTAYINSKGHAHGRDAALRQFYRAMAVVLLGFFVLYNFSLVEGWMDRFIPTDQRLQLPGPSSQLAHPLDTLLHHHTTQHYALHQQRQQRQQQQPQQQHAGSAADPAARDVAGAKPSAAGAQQQQQQLYRRRMRQLLQADLDDTDPEDLAATAGQTISDAQQPDATPSSSSSTVNTRTGDAALSKHQRRLRAAFYVWVNVMNLVGISSLWAKCADAFSPEAGARLFGFISAGATLGQLAGSVVAILASWLAGAMLTKVQASSSSAGGSGDSGSSQVHSSVGSRAAAPASSLLLVAAVLQLAAAQLVTRIRPVAGAAAAAPAAQCTAVLGKPVASSSNSSSGVGGDRAASLLLARRSGGGGSGPSSTAADNGGSSNSSLHTAAGAARDKPQLLAAAAAAVLPHKGCGDDDSSSAARAGGLDGPAGNGLLSSHSVSAACGAAAADGSTDKGGAAANRLTVGGGSGSGSSSSMKGDKAAASFQLRKVLTGFHLIWQSPYLLLVCSNLLLTYVVGSLMYFQRALVVSAAAAAHGPTFRTAFFAALNTWSATAILLMQLFATSSLLRWMGMSAALGLAPVICLTSLLSIASCPVPWMVAVSEVLRKVFGYAVLRPAREVLFTVVSREEKYSAKLVIDTVIQRLGDALAAAVFQVLDVQYSLGQAGVGAAGCVMCVAWLVTALALGRSHKLLAHADVALKV